MGAITTALPGPGDSPPPEPRDENPALEVYEEMLEAGPERVETEFWEALGDPRESKSFREVLHRHLTRKPRYANELAGFIDALMVIHAAKIAEERAEAEAESQLIDRYEDACYYA